MNTTETENLAAVHAYLKALESGAVGEALSRFFTADAMQIELPNKLNPNGGQSDLATLLLRAEQGQRILVGQSYEVRSAIARDSSVAVEALWTGTLAVPVGALQAGVEMKAHFAMFFELSGGLIRLQRNYDCFEPW